MIPFVIVRELLQEGGADLPPGKIPCMKGEGFLHKEGEFFQFFFGGLCMDPVESREPPADHLSSHSGVGGQHTLFHKEFRFSHFFRFKGSYMKRIFRHSDPDLFHIHGKIKLFFFPDLPPFAGHIQKKCKTVFPGGLPGGGSLAAVDELLQFPVGETFGDPDKRMAPFNGKDLSILFPYSKDHRVGGGKLSLFQTDPACKSRRQHGAEIAGNIGGKPSFCRGESKAGAGSHIGRHICNVDAQKEYPFLFPFHSKGVIKISGIFRIDGKGVKSGKIRPFGEGA